MKFKVIGTKTILQPQDLLVVASFLARPDQYEPADKEAKKAAADLDKPEEDEEESGEPDGAGTGEQ